MFTVLAAANRPPRLIGFVSGQPDTEGTGLSVLFARFQERPVFQLMRDPPVL
jgi:hypothetical protein